MQPACFTNIYATTIGIFFGGTWSQPDQLFSMLAGRKLGLSGDSVTLRRGYAWLHWDWSVVDTHKSVWFDISASTLKSPLHSDLSPLHDLISSCFPHLGLDDTDNWQALVGLYGDNDSESESDLQNLSQKSQEVSKQFFILKWSLKIFDTRCQIYRSFFMPVLRPEEAMLFSWPWNVFCLSVWYFALTRDYHADK